MHNVEIIKVDPGEGNANPLQHSCLGNPKDKKAGGLQSVGSQGLDTT